MLLDKVNVLDKEIKENFKKVLYILIKVKFKFSDKEGLLDKKVKEKVEKI